MRLQAAAVPLGRARPYPLIFQAGDPAVIDPAPMWAELARDLAAGTGAEAIAARFHRGWASVWADALRAAAGEHDVRMVFLSGGVFQNRLIAPMLRQRLGGAGLALRQHREVPANDGGLALGQIAVALARCAASEGADPCASESPAR